MKSARELISASNKLNDGLKPVMIGLGILAADAKANILSLEGASSLILRCLRQGF